MGGKGKKKIEIKKIENKERLFVTFSKRRNGVFKKVKEIALLTGCRVAALVFSPSAKKPEASGDLSVIDQYISDTCDNEVTQEYEIDVNAAMQIHACRNLEDVNDMQELIAMRDELQLIRDTLLQRLI